MRRLSEHELEPLAAEPRHGRVGLVESGGQQQRIMGALLETHYDFTFRHRHLSGRVHEVAKQVPRLGGFISMPDAAAQQAVSMLPPVSAARPISATMLGLRRSTIRI